MLNEDEEDKRIYKVVINHEEQYSLWPHEKANPLGWRDEGTVGKKAECLQRIEEVWTDMRPLSLRLHMEKMQMQRADAKQGAAEVRKTDA